MIIPTYCREDNEEMFNLDVGGKTPRSQVRTETLIHMKGFGLSGIELESSEVKCGEETTEPA